LTKPSPWVSFNKTPSDRIASIDAPLNLENFVARNSMYIKNLSLGLICTCVFSLASCCVYAGQPVATISATDNSASEAGLATGTFRINLDQPAPTALSIIYSRAGTAVNGTDYNTLSGSAPIAAGASFVDITLTPIDDTLDEENETVTLQVTAGTGYTIGGANTATVTIADDDAPPETGFIEIGDAAEIESSFNRFFRIELTASSGKTVSVSYQITGSAVLGVNYSAPATSGIATFPSGQTIVDVPYTLIDDTIDHGDTSIGISLSNPVNVVFGEAPLSSTYSLVISDNDRTVSFSQKFSQGSEENISPTIELQLSSAQQTFQFLNVDVTVIGGSASGDDYTLGSQTVTFFPGSGSVANVPITLVDDTLAEGYETISFVLSNPDGMLLGSQTTHTFTIIDNEPDSPQVNTPAVATPNPTIGTTTSLSALGSDNGGEANLKYTWSVTAKPAGAADPTFSINGTNASKNTVATFNRIGSYTLQVAIADLGNLKAYSSVDITVNPTFTTVVVTPSPTTVGVGKTKQFTASARDQFGIALTSQPTFTWAVTSGSGTVSASGLFTAPGSAGASVVRATSGGKNGTANVTISPPPTVATPAACSPNPVTATTATLSVLGAHNSGEPTLTYTWAVTAKPAGASNPTFSPNGTNAAKSTTCTFTKAGEYTFQVTITDANTLTVVSTVNVMVAQTYTSVSVVPASVSIGRSAPFQFVANALDQFGQRMISQPSFTWSVTGGGSVNTSSGLFTAGTTAGGPHTLTASSGGKSNTSSITIVTNAPPSVATLPSATPATVTGTTTALSVMGADDGGEPALTYTWDLTGSPPAPVRFSANGTNAARNTTATFSKAGPYTFRVTIRDTSNNQFTATVPVTVTSVLTTISLSPATVVLNTSAGPGPTNQVFTPASQDQFGIVMSPALTWTVSGGGTMSSGSFSAGATAGGPFTVTATNAATGKTGTASVTLNAAPVKTAEASATALSSTKIRLNVSATDDGGIANLRYTWATTGSPPGPVTYNINGTNQASTVDVTVGKIGTYAFLVTITDALGRTATSTITAPTINAVPTTVVVNPSNATINPSTTQSFSAVVTDQFANVISPPVVTWTATGGTISTGGVYTAATGTGLFAATATSGSIVTNASVRISAAPTVATSAAATPATVTGTTTDLTVLGADDDGESKLTYNWTAVPATVTFSANGSNAAKSVKAFFSQSGTYNLTVTIRDAGNLAITSAVSVVVNQTLTTVRVTPASVTVAPSLTRQFSATGLDQFEISYIPQPVFTWSVNGGGTINSTGLFTASATPGGPFTVTATGGGKTGTAPYFVNTTPIVENLPTSIAANTTLSANKIYKMVGNTTINAGVTLTIPPGTIIKVSGNFTLTVNGSLDATGLTTNRIYFTTFTDDSVGGDSNANGADPVPSRGSWAGILGTAVGHSIKLDYCDIRYAGSNTATGAVSSSSGILASIKNSRITDSASRGLHVYAATTGATAWNIASNAIARCTNVGMEVGTAGNTSLTITALSGNSVSGCGDVGYSISPDISLAGNDVSATVPNGNQNAIRVRTGTVNRNVTWQLPTNSTRVFVDGRVTVASTYTLTIPAGMVVKFKRNTVSGFTVQGTLNAIGTSSNKIYFTSARDTDSLVGGAALIDTGAVAADDWFGIESNTADHVLRLEYCEVRYAGSGAAAINSSTAKTFTLLNSAIKNSKTKGIYLAAHTASTWNISGNTISNSGTYGMDINSNSSSTAALTITALSGNTFIGNGTTNGEAALYVSPDIPFSGNTFSTSTPNKFQNAVRMKSGTIRKAVTWSLPTNSKIIYLDSSVSVAAGASLTIPAGVIVKFASSATLNVSGTLTAIGTSSNRIYFTSGLDADVTAGGAALGATGTPPRGAWGGISVSGTASMLRAEYCTVRYSGNSTAAISASATTPITIKNCNISDSLRDGIYIANPKFLFIENNTISNVDESGLEISTSISLAANSIINNTIQSANLSGINITADTSANLLSLIGNTVQNCGGYGIESSGSNIVATNSNLMTNRLGGCKIAGTTGTGDLRLSWWGSNTGPNAGPQTGSGAILVGSALYNPWRNAQLSGTPLVRSLLFDADTFNPGDNNFGNPLRITGFFDASASWSLSISNSSAQVVQTYTGTGSSLSQLWDGRNSSGSLVPAGKYTISATVSSGSRNEVITGFVSVDYGQAFVTITSPVANTLVLPSGSTTITGVVFSPSIGEMATSYRIYYGYGSEPHSWTELTAVGSLDISKPTPVSYSFSIPATASAGYITLRLRAFLPNDQFREKKVSLGYFNATALNNVVFSPNNDGAFDTTTASGFTGPLCNWTVRVMNGATEHRTNTFNNVTGIQYDWDGKNNASAVVPDAPYVINLVAAGPVNTITRTFNCSVDNTVPNLAITTPAASATISGRVSIVGTASDLNFVNYVLEFGQGASPASFTTIKTLPTQVTNGELGVFDTFLLPVGTYTLRLRSVDSVNNSNVRTTTVQVDRISITGITYSSKEFGPSFNQTTTIGYTIDKPAQVTVTMSPLSWTYDTFYVFNTGTIGSSVRTFQNTHAAAGTYSIVWNGRTGPNGTDPLVPEGCYIIKITALQTATPLVGEYYPPYSLIRPESRPPTEPVEPVYQAPVTAGVDAPVVTPYGQGMSLKYKFNTPVFTIAQAFAGEDRVGDFVARQPRGAATHTDIWDGRFATGAVGGTPGTIAPSRTYTAYILALRTPVNSVLVKNDFSIKNVTAEQFRITELYAHVSTIKFELSHTSRVGIAILRPDGNVFRTLRSKITDPALAAGAQTFPIPWDGKSDAGNIIDTEGAYTLEITATPDAATSITKTATAVIEVYK